MTELHDNLNPRYLPHLEDYAVLQMGLKPLQKNRWIETDADLNRYILHKKSQRKARGDKVYCALPGSESAQQELAESLLAHLTRDQYSFYQQQEEALVFAPSNLHLGLAEAEPLWEASLWVADDIVLLQEIEGEYRLTAASVCCPSSWRLEQKMYLPLAAIHAPIPGFAKTLTPSVNRFFDHLKVAHPVERFNWSLQASDALCQRDARAQDINAATRVHYRTERQTLTRLPKTGAIAFTIRVYVHALESLASCSGALSALFHEIDNTPTELARYKGFTALAPALTKYRGRS